MYFFKQIRLFIYICVHGELLHFQYTLIVYGLHVLSITFGSRGISTCRNGEKMFVKAWTSRPQKHLIAIFYSDWSDAICSSWKDKRRKAVSSCALLILMLWVTLEAFSFDAFCLFLFHPTSVSRQGRYWYSILVYIFLCSLAITVHAILSDALIITEVQQNCSYFTN